MKWYKRIELSWRKHEGFASWVAAYAEQHPDCTEEQAFDDCPPEYPFLYCWLTVLPKTSDRWMVFARSEHRYFREVAAEAALPRDNYLFLLDDQDHQVRWSMIRRLEEKDVELVERALSDPYPLNQAKAIYRLSPYSARHIELAKSPHKEVREAALRQSWRYSPVADMLLDDPDPLLRGFAADRMRTRIPVGEAEKLALSTKSEDRKEAVRHLPPGHPLLQKLAADADPCVKAQLTKVLPVDHPLAFLLADDPDIVEHAAFPAWDKLQERLTVIPPAPAVWKTYPNQSVRCNYVSRLPADSPELAEIAISDDFAMVDSAIRRMPEVPEELLRDLAASRDWRIRASVAKVLSPSHLLREQLAHDPDVSVRDAAIRWWSCTET